MKEQSPQARPDHRNVCEKIEGDRPTEMGVRPAYAERATGTPPAGRRVPSSVSTRVGFSKCSSTLRPLLPGSLEAVALGQTG